MALALIIIFHTKRQNNIQAKWKSLSEKAVSARIYYMKRAARCRHGMSPDTPRSESRSSSASSKRNYAAEGRKALRAWKSDSGFYSSSIDF
jgi:hypothetical protein